MPPTEDLFAELARRAADGPELPALLAPSRNPLTRRDLWSHVRYIAGVLRESGSVTAVLLPDGPELFAALLGAMLAGAAAPLNPQLTTSELHRQLRSLQPECAILGPQPNQALEAILKDLHIAIWRAEAGPGQPAGAFTLWNDRRALPSRPPRSLPPDTRLLLHTSGTAGQPKIVPLTGANLRAGLANQRRAFQLAPADRFLSLAPLYHLHGLASAGAQLTAGGSVVCTPGFESREFPTWLRQFRPTWYTGAPAVHRAIAALAAAKLPCDSLRFVRSSSAALDIALHAAVERALGVPLLDTYGLTETGIVAANPLPPLRRKGGSCGPSAGPEISILAPDGTPLPNGVEGLIAVSGPNVITGYLDDAAHGESFRDGWFLTGDAGRLDPDGYLFITGRRQDVINRGGAKMMPAEIEQALLSHPEVAEAAVFAVPHPTLGEEPEAAVVLRAGAQLRESQLREHAAMRLAGFKAPRRIHFTTAIPKTSTGKPRRDGLAALLPTPASSQAPPVLTAEESRIAACCCAVLGRHQIAPHENLFAAGADSLSAAAILAKVQAEFGIATPLFAFFEEPCIEHLARLVIAARAQPATPAVHIAGDGLSTPLFCIPALGLEPYHLRHLAARLDPQRPFFIVAAPFRSPAARPIPIAEIARAAVADIHAARSRGPYILAGHCSGGAVAFEAACQMRAAGEDVKLLLLFDTPAPGYPKPFANARRYAPAAWRLWRDAGTQALAREAAAHLRMLGRHRRRAVDPADDLSVVRSILHSYAPQPLDIPIVQVLAAAHPASTRVLDDNRLGWRKFARAGFTVVTSPGDHDSFLAPPHIDEAVRHLQFILSSTAP